MGKMLLVLFIITAGLLYAEDLNPEARVIRNNSPEGYAVIKATAIVEWGSDHEMILYTINNQSKSCFDVFQLALAPGGNLNIFVDAVADWSYPGMAIYNLTIIEAWLGGADFNTMFTLECDWEMVLYEYKQQMSAAGKY